MKKEEFVTRLSILLNQPDSELKTVEYFENKKHDDLLVELRSYLIKNSEYIGNPRIEILQGLNDHGVDILIETSNQIKFGIQVKSHFDVNEDKFAENVKRQITESTFHEIQKLYILICSPLKSGKQNYKQKISHLMSELSGLKTNFHCTIGPLNCIGLFKKNKKLNSDNFYSIFKLYVTEEVNKESIIKEVAPIEFRSFFLNRLKPEKPKDFTNGEGLYKYLQSNEFKLNRKKYESELTRYCSNLKKIPRASRDFFSSVLSLAAGYGELGNCINCIKTAYIDVKDSLQLDDYEIMDRIKNLERFKLLEYDEFDPIEDGQVVIEIKNFCDLDDDLNLSFEIREYLKNDIQKLKTFFIDLNFSLID